jgi:Undecaprenyl-phosphate glucose phosphotransferase
MVFLCFILFIFLIKVSTYFSRFWFFSWFCSSVTLLYISRIFCYRLFYRWATEGKLARNIAIIGGGEQAKQLLSYLRQLQEPWNKVVGVFDDRLQRTDLNIMGHPLLGETKDVLNVARMYRLDDIIIALPWHADRRIREIVNKLKELPVPIRLSSDLAGISYMERQSSRLGNALMLDITSKPISGNAILLKALEDKILGVLILAAVAPVMAIIAMAIKLDSNGPVFFRQKRHGFNSQKFMVYKFRTMIHDPLPEQNFRQATQNDPRVTRIGRFLRRSSLDELPQLFNVLEGTMSLVGPRPHAVSMDEQYAPLIEGYFARHRVKPGITGWAQVCGLRGETQDPKMLKARVEHDIFYIENWNLFLDMKILVMTAFVGFIHKNAY